MHPGTVIFDFDNTLFKTREFWREYLFPKFIPLGLPQSLSEEAFIEATQKKSDHFVVDFFLESLRDRKPELFGAVTDVFHIAMASQEIRKWFYPSAIALVECARKKYASIALVSYGDASFKEKFFETCGIYELFPEHQVTITSQKKSGLISGLKVGLVDSWQERGPIVFINDVLQETIEVVARAEELGIAIHAYNVSKEKNSHALSSITHVESLGEIVL